MKFTMAIAGIAMLAAASPVHAHHSFSMFDHQRKLVIEGTVKEFELVNPHSWLYVLTTDADGNVAEWTIEMGGPGGMARSGWRADTVKPGDKIAVEIHPLKDGTYGGQYLNATLSDGRIMEGGDSGVPPQAR